MGFTIGVVGASGGLGASTLTAALALRAHTIIDDCRATVAVDLDLRGGLDTTMCVEHVDGPRWADVEMRSWSQAGTDPAVLVAHLPGDEQVRVLAGSAGPLSDRRIIEETLDALIGASDLVAVDCGARPQSPILSRLDLLVVLARATARGAADVESLVRSCPMSRTQAVLVTRGARGDRSGSALSREVGIPLLAHLPDDRAVVKHAGEGVPPGALRSGVDVVADEVLTRVESTWLYTLMDRLDELGQSDRSPRWTV